MRIISSALTCRDQHQFLQQLSEWLASEIPAPADGLPLLLQLIVFDSFTFPSLPRNLSQRSQTFLRENHLTTIGPGHHMIHCAGIFNSQLPGHLLSLLTSIIPSNHKVPESRTDPFGLQASSHPPYPQPKNHKHLLLTKENAYLKYSRNHVNSIASISFLLGLISAPSGVGR